MGKNKRKRVVLSLQTKLEIAEAIENGSSTPSMLCKKYNIGRSTVGNIVKKKESILRAAKESPAGISSNRKTLYGARHPQLEKALCSWVKQQRASNNVVSQGLLVQKAQWIYKKMVEHGVYDRAPFTASSGWINGFKIRNGLKLSMPHAENIPTSKDRVYSDDELIKIATGQRELLNFIRNSQ
jgi:hypothetical protein